MHPTLIMEEEESHMPTLSEELIVDTNYVNFPEKNGAKTQQRLKGGEGQRSGAELQPCRSENGNESQPCTKSCNRWEGKRDPKKLARILIEQGPMHLPNQATAASEHWVVSGTSKSKVINMELVNHTNTQNSMNDSMGLELLREEHHSDPSELPLEDLREEGKMDVYSESCPKALPKITSRTIPKAKHSSQDGEAD